MNFSLKQSCGKDAEARPLGTKCCRGIALVITLILLAVITFLAVAFLALSRRETASMSASRRQTDAKLASDTALARAQAELIARIIGQNNFLSYDLMVSRNYINPAGFDPAGTAWDTNNVNYDYTTAGFPLSQVQHIQNIANLFFDPRPPVFIATNGLGLNEFRFYFDFNRNARFDPNGILTNVVDEFGTLEINTNGNYVSNFFVGDPEWIGILQKPEYPHSPTNYFVGRYAYLVVPEGKTLDLNFIHNYAKGTTPLHRPEDVINGFPVMDMRWDMFRRNQGVGSWEINLAALLKDWNTTNYGTNFINKPIYAYNLAAGTNGGLPFEDALTLLRYRYASNHTALSLKSAEQTLTPLAWAIRTREFTNDLFDGYANGPLLTNTLNFPFDDDDLITNSWAGSRNPHYYEDIQDIFNANKTSQDFTNRLITSGLKTNTYERYSFYRLLSILDVNSDTNDTFTANGETYRKVHINYDNFGATNVVSGATNGFAVQTNFAYWSPSNFFFYASEALINRSIVRTNANDWGLGGVRVRPGFSPTNIMVYPTNEYTPTVHRLLQLAANIYGATTNGFLTNTSPAATNLPFVFRPLFRKEGTNIYIRGYEEETSTNIGPFFDLAGFAATNASDEPMMQGTNFYGVPWVISAKKGLPNFNEFSMNTMLQVTRKLEFRKPNTNYTTLPNETNQMYVVSVTNALGIEFWNSYTNIYPRRFRVSCTNRFSALLTNQAGVILRTNFSAPFTSNNVFAFWPPAYTRTNVSQNADGQSFLVFSTNEVFLPESQYTTVPFFYSDQLNRYFYAMTNSKVMFQRTNDYQVPNWGLTLSNCVVCAIEDVVVGRIIDLVNLNRLALFIDFSKELPPNDPSVALGNEGGNLNIHDFFRTNRPYGGTDNRFITEGIDRQIRVSLGEYSRATINSVWNDYNLKGTGRDKWDEINEFRAFVGGLTPLEAGKVYNPTNRMAAPFSPTITLAFRSRWQANDPLVHYTPEDLQQPEEDKTPLSLTRTTISSAADDSNLRKINQVYRPWGGKRVPTRNPQKTGDEQAYNFAIKDSMIRWSDDWKFPTNKFPSVGWLGRVHRGTPWQTMYLKSDMADTNVWDKWTTRVMATHPTNDWDLLDVFTIAPNANAARGLLSVNQTNIASWSAVLSGVLALTNVLDNPGEGTPLTYETMPIEPTSAQLSNIVASIYSARTNRPGQTFRSMGEVLAADAMTVNSPFLYLTNLNDTAGVNDPKKYALDDNAYERIPQQVLSLLKSDRPRVTVYAVGQSLKPAENSILVSPPAGMGYLQNLCTNYQVTGEVVARAVLRIEQKIDWVSDPARPKTNYQAVIESYRILPEE